MKLVNLTLQQTFNSAPLDIYNILTDERKHASFTGDVVGVSAIEHEDITLGDGVINGKNIILERGQKIVWALRWNNANWPQHHFSEAAIILKPNQHGGCELTVFHTAIPQEFEETISGFWQQKYWPALRYYLDR